MAKKAQASAKAVVKAKAQASTKKPGKATASPKPAAAAKAPPAKSSAKAAAKPIIGKKPAPSNVEKKPALAPVAPAVAAPKKSAAKVKGTSEKAAQAAEASEKVKIDKSMTEEQAKWVEMYNKYKDAQASNYDMRATFKAASSIQHKVLGWGWIVSNENDRLEVLFKDGKRMLISNYKG